MAILSIPIDPLWTGSAAFRYFSVGSLLYWFTRRPEEPLRPVRLTLTIPTMLLRLLMIQLSLLLSGHLHGITILVFVGLPATLGATMLLKRAPQAAVVVLSGLAMAGAYLGTLYVRRTSWEAKTWPESYDGAGSLTWLLLFSAFGIAPFLLLALEQRRKACERNQAAERALDSSGIAQISRL